jgi:hypothetical protein
MMISLRAAVLATCCAALLLSASQQSFAQGMRSAAVRPAIYTPSYAAATSPVSWGWHRGYGYSSGYGYGTYGQYPTRSVYYGPSYNLNYAAPYYSPYGSFGSSGYNSYNRPWYTYSMGYWRYGYYSYPTYRMYGYPYTYSNGFHPFSYYSGFYPSNVGAAPIMSTPIVNANVGPPVVAAPYVYGGFYTYPVYGGGVYNNYGNCW